MQVDKADIIAILRQRGKEDRAEWVDRQLPDVVDTETNGSLLRLLDIDLTALPAHEPVVQG